MGTIPAVSGNLGVAFAALLAVTIAGACGQRIGGTNPPRPLPVGRSMMCDGAPVHARASSPREGTDLPPKGSPSRAILRAVCKQYAELAACYGDALWRDSASSGLVTLRLRTLEDGRMGEVCFLDTAINDREMLECIRERFLKIELPQFDQRTVVYPIDYRLVRSGAHSPDSQSSCEVLRLEDAEP